MYRRTIPAPKLLIIRLINGQLITLNLRKVYRGLGRLFKRYGNVFSVILMLLLLLLLLQGHGVHCRTGLQSLDVTLARRRSAATSQDICCLMMTITSGQVDHRVK